MPYTTRERKMNWVTRWSRYIIHPFPVSRIIYVLQETTHRRSITSTHSRFKLILLLNTNHKLLEENKDPYQLTREFTIDPLTKNMNSWAKLWQYTKFTTFKEEVPKQNDFSNMSGDRNFLTHLLLVLCNISTMETAKRDHPSKHQHSLAPSINWASW